VVHDELRAAAEEVQQAGGAVVGVEAVVLVDSHPGKVLTLAGELVAATGELILGVQQGEPAVSHSSRLPTG